MIDLTKLKTNYITDKNGNRVSVILPLPEFEELLEDIQDLAVAAERKEESTLTHEDVIKELREDGTIRD